jgi:transposase
MPISTRAVHVELKVRRFRCHTADCKRQTFAEPLLGVTSSYSRRTDRLTEVLWHLGQVAGGSPGARLSNHLRMPISRQSLLRLLRRKVEDVAHTPRVIGLDDWAKRKGQTYGTIVVDLEQHCVVELLDTRDAQSVADWLRSHPQLEVVASDRSNEYTRGIREGAPQAVQVADRWHLLKNLSDALVNTVVEWRAHTRRLSRYAHLTRPSLPRSSTDEARRQANYEKRLSRWLFVKQLHARGISSRRIARLTGLSRGTVLKYVRLETFPERQRPPKPSMLDPYLDYLNQRVSEEEAVSASQLWQEIQKLGYPGSSSQVRKWLTGYRSKGTANPELQPVSNPIQLPSQSVCFRLLSFQPDWLADDERVLLDHLLENQDFALLHHLAQTFSTMIHEQQADELDAWLNAADHSPFPILKRFALSVRRDYQAVKAALQFPWSNGPTEGYIHKLKLLKRQMYGRANLDLLRLRLLYSGP